jgi:integrase/recombinase XerD
MRKRQETVEYPIVARYERHLLDDRGIRGGSGLRKYIDVATCFLDFVGARGTAIDTITWGVIDDFIVEQGTQYQRVTVANIVGALRSFFRFLLSRGVVHMDWAAVITRPRVFQGRRDPRYLKPGDVRRVLATVERTSVVGKRNYAILVLLGLYGLRACEVARLSLDDIGWRSKVLRVCHRKCDDTLELPLLPAAGAALVEYLHLRGGNGHREVFLSSAKPFGPLRTASISNMVREAIIRAGVEVNHPGSHSFRYATAQALFRAERPIEEIAEVLGHRDLRWVRLLWNDGYLTTRRCLRCRAAHEVRGQASGTSPFA